MPAYRCHIVYPALWLALAWATLARADKPAAGANRILAEGVPALTDRYGDPLPPGALARLGTVRYRCGVVGLAFLPDSKTIVSAGQGHTIIMWDARTGRRLREIDTGRLSIGSLMGRAVAFSRDARRIAVKGWLPDDAKSGWRPAIGIFDTNSGKILRTFERSPDDTVYAVALTPDGKMLLSQDGNGRLRVEEVETSQELRRQQFPRDIGVGLALSADGRTVALASNSDAHKLLFWKWQTAEEPCEIRAREHRGSDLAFSPDGKLLAECSDSEPTVRLWDVATGRPRHRLKPPEHEPSRHFHVAFSPDGKMLAASVLDKHGVRWAVHLWDLAAGKFLKQLAGDGPVLAFSPDGTLLASGARVWDLKAGKELSANEEAHRGGPVEHVLTPARHVVVTSGSDQTLRIWDAATGKQRRRLTLDGWARALALSPDGSLVAANNLLDDAVGVWDMATGRKLYTLAGHGRSGGRRAVAFTPDGKSLLSWGDDMYLRQWDLRTGKAIAEHALRPAGIHVAGKDADPRQREQFSITLGDCQFTPDGKHVILLADGNFFVFDCATGKQLRKFPSVNPSFRTSFLAISPESKLLLASALGDAVTGQTVT
jgi:WD40 repeat protein